jgi:hypothetical protein
MPMPGMSVMIGIPLPRKLGLKPRPSRTALISTYYEELLNTHFAGKDFCKSGKIFA